MNTQEITIGANQENAAYPVCLCAEGVALSNASMQFPQIPIQSMAITVKTINQNALKPIAPCGVCRQSIAEYENRFHQNIRIILREIWRSIYPQ